MGIVHRAGSVARRAAFGLLGESGYERLRPRHLPRKISSGTDDALRDAGEISFVKIDVEGADLQVLRGAETILARDVPTVLIEVSPRLLARQGLRTDDVGAFFDRHGYATYRFDQHTKTLRPWPARDAEGDLVAVHPRRTDRVRALLAG